MGTPDFSTPVKIRLEAHIIAWLIVVTFGAFFVWGGLAQLDSGAIAQGEVIPSGRIRTVQHLEGGIIKAIYVNEGDLVVSGQLLIQLSDIKERAALSKQQTGLRIKLLEARNELDAWKVKGDKLRALRNSALEELQVNQRLLEGQFISRVRLVQLEGRLSEIDASVSENDAEISRSKQKIGELTASLSDIVVSEDRLARTQIRAPQSGIISNLRFTTLGGVIPATSPILDIVPDSEELLIEAKVSADDIDVVQAGLECQVKLTAYKARSHISLRGRVKQVSGTTFRDSVQGTLGRPYYKVLIEIEPDELKKLDRGIITPGMLAEVQIVAGRRTALRYLFDPILDSIGRAFHES